MGTCLHCYGPIEKEKLEVLPEARYCIKCAKLLNDKPRRTQAEMDFHQQRLPVSRQTVTIVVPKGVNVNGKRRKLPAVLREEVYDDGRSVQTFLGRRGKKEKKKSSSSSSTSPSAWRYESSEQAMEGDVIYTENSSLEEHDHLWVVDTVETNCVQCHCETRGKENWLHTFYIRQMKLLFRKEETTNENEVKKASAKS